MEVLITKNPVKDALNDVVEPTDDTSSQYSSSSSTQVGDDLMKKNIGTAIEKKEKKDEPPLPLGPAPLPSYNYYNYNINYNYNHHHNMIPPQYYTQQQYYHYIPTLPHASHLPPSPYIHDNNFKRINSYYYPTYTTPQTLLHSPSYFAPPPPPPPPPPPVQRRTALRHKIAKQIDYYFCDDNLAKDLYLKKRMDDEGWVPIKLIAGFRRVSELSKDTKFVLDSLMHSENVEVKGEKVRRRGSWKKWLLNLSKPESKI